MILPLALACCTIASHSALAAQSTRRSGSSTRSTGGSYETGSDMGLKRVGAAVGLVNPEGLDATFGIGVFADWGTMAPRLGLETRLDYWSQSESFFGSDLSIRDITIGARGKYQFPVSNSNIRPFMGAGLGLHMLNAEVGYYDPFSGTTTTSDDSETKLGLDLGGGISTPLNPSTDLLAELWFGLVSDFDQVSLRVGLSHALGR